MTTPRNPIYALLQAREASPYCPAAAREALHRAIDAGETIGYALAVSLARSPTPQELAELLQERSEMKAAVSP